MVTMIEGLRMIMEGKSIKDKILISNYLFFKVPVHLIMRKFGAKKVNNNLFGNVILKTKNGIFFCGKNIFSVFTCSSVYEKNVTEEIKKLKEGVFIDVGANVGRYSIILGNKLKEKGVVIAIEPINRNIEIIKNRKKFVIGYLGGFGKRKNLGFILKLAKKFGKDRKVFFKIAGKGPKKERLENMVKNLGLNNVEFVGFVPDEELNNFYNSLDLFLFPSLYEGFGLPVLEAMACGIPVMVSNIGSLPEIVGDVGMIISINNLIKTKEDIEKIIKNKKIRQEMKNKGIKRTKEFSWDKTINEIIKVYKSI